MRHPWVYAAALLVTLLVVYHLQELVALLPAYRPFIEAHGFWLFGNLRSIAEILLVIAALMAIRRIGLSSAVNRLGLVAPVLHPFLLGLAAVVPLYAVFLVTMPVQPEFSFLKILFLAFLNPVAEETLFRGLAFGELRRELRWPFWLAALAPAVLFGLAHVVGGRPAGDVLMVFLITFVGGLFFSWLYERWNYNLWVPIWVHVLMNLSRNIFEVGDSAYAGWLPTVMQVVTVITAVILTLYWTKRAV